MSQVRPVHRRPRTVPRRARWIGAAGLTILLVVSMIVPLPGLAAPARPTPATLGSGARAAAAVNTSWTNITSDVGRSPSARSLTQAAYSPSLNATILFGGYNGAGGNFALGDTWEYHDHTWTALAPSPSPRARWGGTLVYDPALSALLLFGGRNDTAFFNDTWEYNATGWHNVTGGSAPTPRYDYAMAYDPAVGAVVLYGGATGNNPAGTFTDWRYFHDTWWFADDRWTNVSASAGTPPPGRLIRGQMAFDAYDGYLLLTGGYVYSEVGTCGLSEFSSSWSATWTYGPGGWTDQAIAGVAPPPGAGILWYDSEANRTLYYEGMEESGHGTCGISGNQVWSYADGNWTLVTEGNVSAPAPRILPMFVDDVGDHQQVEFGGEVSTGTEYFATYAADTWTYTPTWAAFEAKGFPTGAAIRATLNGHTNNSRSPLAVVVQGPGTYGYTYTVQSGSGVTLASGKGAVALRQGPATITVIGQGLPPPTPTPAAEDPLPSVVAGVAVGAAAIAVWVGGTVLVRRRRLREEGERLVEEMVREEPRATVRRR